MTTEFSRFFGKNSEQLQQGTVKQQGRAGIHGAQNPPAKTMVSATRQDNQGPGRHGEQTQGDRDR